MGSHDWFGLGLTIIDALDTIYIMDLQEGKNHFNLFISFFVLLQYYNKAIIDHLQNLKRHELGLIFI